MKYVCPVCGYVFDETKEGKSFGALPETWVCPWCGAAKMVFVPEGPVKQEKKAEAPVYMDEDLNPLSPGVLSALCSNLARGCEKQYKADESALFLQLAEYFASVAPADPDTGVEALAALIGDDLKSGYPSLHSAAIAEEDRGTQRICVWGEKVTNILNSLMIRYKTEGEAFLRNTQIWVCTVCGFVYVGNNPPELCPVCKVPAWKFEKVEGRGSV